MSWWKTAKVGDKVVCVDEMPKLFGQRGNAVWDTGEKLALGAVYTIAAIFEAHDGSIHLELLEVCRTPLSKKMYGSVGYAATRFRPVQTKSTETGMAILKSILHSAPVREDA